MYSNATKVMAMSKIPTKVKLEKMRRLGLGASGSGCCARGISASARADFFL